MLCEGKSGTSLRRSDNGQKKKTIKAQCPSAGTLNWGELGCWSVCSDDGRMGRGEILARLHQIYMQLARGWNCYYNIHSGATRRGEARRDLIKTDHHHTAGACHATHATDEFAAPGSAVSYDRGCPAAGPGRRHWVGRWARAFANGMSPTGQETKISQLGPNRPSPRAGSAGEALCRMSDLFYGLGSRLFSHRGHSLADRQMGAKERVPYHPT